MLTVKAVCVRRSISLYRSVNEWRVQVKQMSCVALSQTGGGLTARGLADLTTLLGLFQSVYLNRAMQ